MSGKKNLPKNHTRHTPNILSLHFPDVASYSKFHVQRGVKQQNIWNGPLCESILGGKEVNTTHVPFCQSVKTMLPFQRFGCSGTRVRQNTTYWKSLPACIYHVHQWAHLNSRLCLVVRVVYLCGQTQGVCHSGFKTVVAVDMVVTVRKCMTRLACAQIKE